MRPKCAKLIPSWKGAMWSRRTHASPELRSTDTAPGNSCPCQVRVKHMHDTGTTRSTRVRHESTELTHPARSTQWGHGSDTGLGVWVFGFVGSWDRTRTATIKTPKSPTVVTISLSIPKSPPQQTLFPQLLSLAVVISSPSSRWRWSSKTTTLSRSSRSRPCSGSCNDVERDRRPLAVV